MKIYNLFKNAGFKVNSYITHSPDELDKILDNAEGILVAVGGDGTVKEVAVKAYQRNKPISILPTGTANNIAKTLNINTNVQDYVRGMLNPQETHMDLGEVNTPWGKHYFIEGMGYGFYANNLSSYDPAKGKSILRGLSVLKEELTNLNPIHNLIHIDKKPHQGEHVLVEIMNTTAVGPRLKLAPGASPQDGLLDVVLVEQNSDISIWEHLIKFFKEELEQLPHVKVHQASKVSFHWDGFPIHIDGDVHPIVSEAPQGTIDVKVIHKAVKVFLPGEPDENL
jgi:YegS/Rv2252/BmrU family lipid kinase